MKMDQETRDEFEKIHNLLTKIQVNCMETKTRVEGMRMHIRIGHALLFAILAGGGYIWLV